MMPRPGRSRALIALAQAPVCGARRRPMLEAERALRAAAHPRRAAALWCRERDARGRRSP